MGRHGATPLCPSTRPSTRQPQGRRPPTTPRRADDPREARAGPASTPQPPALAGAAMGKRTRASAHGHHTDRAQRQQADTSWSGMGATPSMARVTPRTPALLPAQGRQRDGLGQGDPPPHWPPRPHSRGERRTGRPHSPYPTPGAGAPQTRRPTPQGAYSPKPGTGETGPGCPTPQANRTGHGTGAGHAEGHGQRGTALPAPSTGTARGARAKPTRGEGRSTDTAGAQGHTHTRGTRGIPEGQPDRARGTHRPHGMAYHRARTRDTQTGQPATQSAGNAGGEGGNGEDTKPGTGPSPPNRPRGPCTQNQGTAPAKAVVARRATHQTQG